MNSRNVLSIAIAVSVGLSSPSALMVEATAVAPRKRTSVSVEGNVRVTDAQRHRGGLECAARRRAVRRRVAARLPWG